MMPFIREEPWQRLPKRPSEKALSIVIAEYPEPAQYPFIDKTLETRVAFAMDVISRRERLLSCDTPLHQTPPLSAIFTFHSGGHYLRHRKGALPKLESKKGKLDGQIAKINELQAKADYETKAPLGVRANNQEKKETLEKELHSLEAALWL
ncbi:unnamed protein product, partial [Mesorhabditis belari]|uniref:Uncharacterized protein n=1 Tax=Mesorhabditis belari TaxID=2138241 RepID=A0AAF3FSE6_9BILA